MLFSVLWLAHRCYCYCCPWIRRRQACLSCCCLFLLRRHCTAAAAWTLKARILASDLEVINCCGFNGALALSCRLSSIARPSSLAMRRFKWSVVGSCLALRVHTVLPLRGKRLGTATSSNPACLMVSSAAWYYQSLSTFKTFHVCWFWEALSFLLLSNLSCFPITLVP